LLCLQFREPFAQPRVVERPHATDLDGTGNLACLCHPLHDTGVEADDRARAPF
jgi:hypothetical protein